MRRSTAVLPGLLLAGPIATLALAAPPEPAFRASFSDCVTGTNRFTSGGQTYWDIAPGCDRYQNDVYERPTIQSYQCVAGRYAAQTYWENLDIVSAQAGANQQFLFVAIRMNGLDEINQSGARARQGLKHEYAFRLSSDPDGRFGFKLKAETPFDANPNPFAWGPLKTFGFRDTDGDVGGAARSGPTGLNVTKSDNPAEEQGLDGYDLAIISDGRLTNRSTPVLWTRLRPGDPAVVEFALEYGALGFTRAQIIDLPYLVFEANKGLLDPQNHLWNDKYTRSEAGSPNRGAGSNCRSEFGTQGLGNIYELDTLTGGAIGECKADVNMDGVKSLEDIFAFLAAYFAGDPSADLNNDGMVTLADLLKCFLPDWFDPAC